MLSIIVGRLLRTKPISSSNVSVADDYDIGGIFSLDTSAYVTLEDGEQLTYFAYNISGGREGTGEIKTFKNNEYSSKSLVRDRVFS